MEGVLYYPETLRNITIALLRAFSNCIVTRYSKDRSTTVKSWPIPIAFAPIDKPEAERTENFTEETVGAKRYYQTIPRLALNFTGMTYDPDRAVSVNNFRSFFDPSQEASVLDSIFEDYMPVPYNYLFTLSIKTNKINDFAQIIEGILPYFNPNFRFRVKELSFLNIDRDLIAVLNDFTPDWSDELNIEEKRKIDGVLTFTVNGFVYRPVAESSIVKVITSRYWAGNDAIYQGDMQQDVSASYVSSAGIPYIVPDSYTSSAFSEDGTVMYFNSASNISDQHS